jgi:hypothetical protein
LGDDQLTEGCDGTMPMNAMVMKSPESANCRGMMIVRIQSHRPEVATSLARTKELEIHLPGMP